MAAEFRLTLNVDLAAAFGGQQPVAATVGPAGEALVLLVDAPEAPVVQERDEQPGRASFPRSRTHRSVGATVLPAGTGQTELQVAAARDVGATVYAGTPDYLKVILDAAAEAGVVLGFAKAIGEFGATITFVSNIPGETQTISSAIYSLIQTPDGDAAAGRLVLISIVIAMSALIASEWFARRATQRLHGN